MKRKHTKSQKTSNHPLTHAIEIDKHTQAKNAIPLTVAWKERGRWRRSECTFLTRREAKEHAEMLGAKTFRIIRQFPDRVVLGTGYPWAAGLGKKTAPYTSVTMLKGRTGFDPKPIKFPTGLWSPCLPQYRLVLERIRTMPPGGD